MELVPTLITLIVATVELVVCLFCAIVLWRQRRGEPDVIFRLAVLPLPIEKAEAIASGLRKND